MDRVQIRLPRKKHTGRQAMPQTFYANGTAKGRNIKSVRAVITGAGYQSGVNEVKTITITGNPTGGTFTLTFAGETTDPPLPHNASAAAVQAALIKLSTIGPQNVACAGGPLPGTAITVTFQGDYAANNVPPMTAQGNFMGGANPDVAVTEAPGSTTTKLVRFETDRFADQPGKFRYMWVIACRGIVDAPPAFPGPAASRTLKVFAVDINDANIPGAVDSVTFDARYKPIEKGPPLIGYPDPGYEIEGGERDNFMPCGTSPVAVSEVSLGGVAAVFTGYDPDLQEWYSVFENLDETPGPGDYFLVATNSSGSTSQDITVADH